MKDRIHILIRFSDSFMSVEDTIAEHRKILKEHGTAWFAKVGRPLGQKNIDTINEQCAAGVPTYLVLVQNVGSHGKTEYRAYKCRIVVMQPNFPKKEQHLFPEYYEDQNVTRAGSLWTKFSNITEMPKGGLTQYHIASSQLTVTSTLKKSMAAMFIIKDGAGIIP